MTNVAAEFRTVSHTVQRLSVPVDAAFDDFRARYEQAVPVLDVARFEALKAEGAAWAAVLTATEENAPHGFIRYWTTDVGSMMTLAGDTARCVAYLMGNHTIAQRMYTHDPAAMLHAPLRTVIHEDRYGVTRFVIDQPSTLFGSFGSAEITAVGLELDHKVADLLAFLDVTVPPVLTAGR